MVSVWLNRLVLCTAVVLAPAILAACGGKEEPKPEVKAPPAPVEKVEVPEPVVEETPAEEVVEEEAPVEEPEVMEAPEEVEEAVPESSEGAEVVPEVLSPNEEMLIFFPVISVGESLDNIVRSFAHENYMHLELFYAGDSEAIFEEFEGNDRIKPCKSSEAQGVIVLSTHNRLENYSISVLGVQGKVVGYSLTKTDLSVRIPDDYPPLVVDFKLQDLVKLADVLKGCGYE